MGASNKLKVFYAGPKVHDFGQVINSIDINGKTLVLECFPDLADAWSALQSTPTFILIVSQSSISGDVTALRDLSKGVFPVVVLLDPLRPDLASHAYRLGAQEYVLADSDGRFVEFLPQVLKKAYEDFAILKEAGGISRKHQKVMDQLHEYSEPLVSMDLEGRIDFCNDTFLSALEYSAAEATGLSFEQLLHTDHKKRFRKILQYVVDNEISSLESEVFTLIGKRGNEVIFESNLKARHTSSGVPIGMAGILRDITTISKHDADLRSSEQQYRLLLESANDIIYSSDSEGNITYLNQHGLEFLGLKQEELKHIRLTDFIDPGYRDKVVEFYGSQFEKLQINSYLEFPIVAKNGTRMWVGQRINLLLDDDKVKKLTGFLGVVRDITEKRIMEQQLLLTNKVLEKRVAWRTNELEKINAKLRNEINLRTSTEEALKQSEQDYRELFQNASDSIIIIDASTESIVEFNEQSLSLYGYSADEFSKKKFKDISDSGSTKAFLAALSKNATTRTECVHLTKSQSKIVVDIHATHVKYKGKDSILCINRDLTEKKEVEEELAVERTRRLTALIDGQEIERKRLSRELHDGLGQLLTASLIYLKQLHNSATETKTIELAQKTRSIIEDTVEEVRSISHNLMPAVLSDFGLEIAIKNMINSITKGSDKKVNLVKKGEIGRLNSDIEIGLYRIAQEALNNCLKYAQAENITVSLIVTNKGMLKLEVKDDGVGFEENSIGMHGSGNGLYNIRQRASIINCEIDITSSIGKGTKVIVLHKLK